MTELQNRRVLVVDDDPEVLAGIQRSFRARFEIVTAESGAAGLESLQRADSPFAVIVSDMRMPNMDGAVFLSRARRLSESSTRVLLTGDTDLRSAIKAVNEGQIFRFLCKPCAPETLGLALDACAEQHALVTAERDIMERTLAAVVTSLSDVLALAEPALFERATVVKLYVAQVVRHLKLEGAWQIEVAAALHTLGLIALPRDVAGRGQNHAPVTLKERQALEGHPETARRILSAIPRLEDVALIVAQQASEATQGAEWVRRGARLLRFAIRVESRVSRGLSLGEALEAMRAVAGDEERTYVDALRTGGADSGGATRKESLATATCRSRVLSVLGGQDDADGRFDSQTKLLIERLAQAELDVETALAGSVDSVTHPGGHTYLLRDAQQALLRSEELANEQAALLRTIVESAPDVVAYVGTDRSLRYLNRSDGHDETVGKDWISLQLPEQQEGLKRTFEHVLATGETTTYEGPGLAPGGTTAFYSRRFGAVVQEGEVVGVVIVSRDITQQRTEHQAVRLQANLLDQVGQAVIAADTSGRISYVNRFASELYGWTSAEMVSRDALSLIVPENATAQARAILARLQRGEGWTGELSLQSKLGRVFPAFLTASPLFDDANHLIGIITVTFDLSEQKRSAAFLSMAARVGRLGAWELKLSPQKLIWSEEVRAIHEVLPDYEPTLEQAVAFYPAESMAIIVGAVEACMRDGTPFDVELQVLTAKGRLIWVRSIGEAQRDSNGKIQRIHGAFQDISQARHAADALRLSEERFRLLARATNDTVWDWDLVSGALWWNEGLETLFGYVLEGPHSTAQFRLERIHPEDLQGTNGRVQEAIDGGRENWWSEYRFRRNDGAYTPVVERGYIMRDDAGRATRMIGGITDLTERKAIAARVANQAVLLDAASDAIYQMDLDGRVLSWNRSAASIYGWSASEAIGQSSRDLLHAEPTQFDQARLRLLQQERWRGELQQRSNTGHALVIEARWTLVRDDYQKPISILSINTDITEKKKLEAQFLRAQRMESVGTLAGGIAHDLNNILAPILMAVASLHEEATNDETREVLETLRSCSQRGADLVRQVLSFARGVEGQRLLVQPSHLMCDIEQIVRQTFPKNVDFRLSHARALWAVEGDPTQLHQVFMNLCVNARDAMPKGGALTVTMENVTLDATYAGMNPESKPGRYVVVKVADTGHGIAPDVREKIFEPFFTTKEVGRGTGLGLSTTATIVRSHAGFICVYSEVGIGTAFSVYLPAAGARASSRPPPGTGEVARPRRGNGELILVVDDEAAVRHITKSTLESFGYRVVLAEDGAQAIGIFAQRRGDIALVLTDMMMPIMDGPALISAMHRIDPSVRVVAASGLHAGGDVARAAQAGVVHFLAKPYTAETMLTLFWDVLGEGRPN